MEECEVPTSSPGSPGSPTSPFLTIMEGSATVHLNPHPSEQHFKSPEHISSVKHSCSSISGHSPGISSTIGHLPGFLSVITKNIIK